MRGPRGLDAVLGAMPDHTPHTERVRLLNTPDPALDHLSPLEWLRDEGAAAAPIALVLLSPPQLIARLETMLGPELLDEIYPTENLEAARSHRPDDEPPSRDFLLSLGTVFHAALLLYQADAEEAPAWFRRKQPRLNNRVPVQLLGEESLAVAGPMLIAAVRRQLGLPL